MVVLWVYPHDVHYIPPTVQHQTQWFHWHVIQYLLCHLGSVERQKGPIPLFNQQEWGVLPAKIGFQAKKNGELDVEFYQQQSIEII